MPSPNDRELKRVEIKVSSLEADGTFVGLASVYEKADLGNDVVKKGAFTKTIKERGTVPILWQHDEKQPIGSGVLTDSDAGLVIKGKLSLGVERAKEAYELLKDKVISGLSIGFQTVKDEMKEGTRHIREAKLWEVSVVTFPMMPDAVVSSVKSIDADRKDFNEELEKIQGWSVRGQTISALYCSLDMLAYSSEVPAETDRVAASGEVIDQFKTAYLAALPKFLELMDERSMSYYAAKIEMERKAGRRLSAATRSVLEKVQNEIKALLDADEAVEEEKAAAAPAEPQPAPEVPSVPDHSVFKELAAFAETAFR